MINPLFDMAETVLGWPGLHARRCWLLASADPDRWSLQWPGAPDGDWALLWLVVAGGIFWGTLWLYRRESSVLPRRVRGVLTGLRLLVLLGVAVMLLEPVLVVHTSADAPSTVAVLIDTSASMGFGDAYADEEVAADLVEQMGLTGGVSELRKSSRLELVRRVLGRGALEPLAAQGDRKVSLHCFSDRFEAADPSRQAETGEPLETVVIGSPGGATALGWAIRETLANYRGQPLAGIVLVSDGQSTAGPSPIKAAEHAGREGVPIAVLGVGTAKGPRNARVVKLDTSPVVFVHDPIELRVIIESRSMGGEPAEVLLERRVDGGAWDQVALRSLTLGETGLMQTVTMPYHYDALGRLDFRAALSTRETELDLEDNIGIAQVQVIRQQIRVLLVAGIAFPEFQFLRSALTRDRGISLSSWLQSAGRGYNHMGNRPIRRLPVTQEELNDYDCVILYDPEPDGWPQQFAQMLVEFVGSAGGGLVFVAGERTASELFESGPSDRIRPLFDLLPVIREPGLFDTAVDIRLSARQAWRLAITPEGVADPIFRFLEPPQANARILSSLPGMYWHLPVTRAKSGAIVLARHGDPRMRNRHGAHVLMATHLYGPGRTFFLGFDSTYRWRYLDQQYFDGFWARVVDRAGRNKQLGGHYPFKVATDRETYVPGSQVTLSVRFVNPRDGAVSVLSGQLEHADHDPVPLTLLRDNGVFRTTFSVSKTGLYAIKVWSGEAGHGQDIRAATHQFQVQLENPEYERPAQDRATLEAIASASGGQYFALHQAMSLADVFRVRRVSIPQSRRQDLWDAPLLWGLILLAVFSEWILRKRYRLL